MLGKKGELPINIEEDAIFVICPRVQRYESDFTCPNCGKLHPVVMTIVYQNPRTSVQINSSRRVIERTKKE